jgi:predicted anti-sigma-YlaC factor YlaD
LLSERQIRGELGFFEGDMHRSIRVRLEDLLAAGGYAIRDKEISTHLTSCQECSAEFSSMQAQKEMFTSLRASEDIEPSPGFYARVVQRIEECAKESMWGAFIYSPFAKRLVYASLTLAVMLGTYVVTTEARDGHLLGSAAVVAQTAHFDAPVTGNETEQRDAVLENFAVHEGLSR